MTDARMKLLTDLLIAPATKWEFPDQAPAEKVVGEVHITYEKAGFSIWSPPRLSMTLSPQEFDNSDFQAARKSFDRQANEARAMPCVLALRQLAFGDTK